MSYWVEPTEGDALEPCAHCAFLTRIRDGSTPVCHDCYGLILLRAREKELLEAIEAACKVTAQRRGGQV